MMDNKPEECSVCYNDYDDNQLRPRTLPCGHTFCSQCIDNAIENGQLTCPNCRAQHAATAATQFPISYAVEAFVRKLKDIQLTQKKTVPVKKKLHSLVQEQKSSISSLITSCEEVLSQLGEYRGQLGDWKTCHLQLQDRLYALVEENKSAMQLLELEDTSVVDMTTQGEEGKTQLQAMLGNLDTVNTLQEVDTTIDTADGCSMKVEDWLQKCQELFPDVKTDPCPLTEAQRASDTLPSGVVECHHSPSYPESIQEDSEPKQTTAGFEETETLKLPTNSQTMSAPTPCQ
ncbi:tripartite motif-containing protein 59-like [Procambarus clarkii]|uniref:tripartite motif-containing protein 59-like n=1 Tax=Procambarus clarkii TaxID=6728 RepID=UPI003743950F